MTRENKVNLLNKLLEIEEKNDVGNLTSTDRREFQQWVEELEQEPILDKIRAEIVELQKDYQEYGWAYDDAIEIIDKYREGAEE